MYCLVIWNLQILRNDRHDKFSNHLSPYNVITIFSSGQSSSVQSLSRVWLFATPWITAHQASLSVTISQSSPRLIIGHISCAGYCVRVAYLSYKWRLEPFNLLHPFPPLPSGKHLFALCITESVSILFCSVFAFCIPYISEIKRYLFVSVWLISLSIIPWILSTHIVASGKYIFNDWEIFHSGEGNGNPLQWGSCLGNPWIQESGGLQLIELQRVRHNWVTNTHKGRDGNLERWQICHLSLLYRCLENHK